MSRCLTERSIDHVVLERGEVAHSWRTERWDSLHLLTPNWQSRLPGYGYQGDDPDGYRALPEVIDFIAELREGDRRAGADPHDGDIGAPDRVGIPRAHRSGRLAMPHAGARFRRLQHRRASQPSPSGCRARSRSSRRSNTAIPASSPTAASWLSAHRRAARRSRTKSSAPAGRWSCRSANISARRGSTAARTWNGGWTPPACSTSATIKSTTSSGRGACRRCSLPARPIARRSISTR